MDVSKIIDFINSIIDGNSKEIEDYSDCYAINSNGYKGIAIKTTNDLQINESFNKVKIINCILNVSSEKFNAILLYTNEQNMSYHYGMLCVDFLNKKDLITTNPMKWFEEWKDLLGNYRKEQMVYDVIGEMKVLLHFQKENHNPKWDSINLGTYDISSTEAFYEVKTTTSKSNENIVIHSQFQLNVQALKNPLYIALCKVEENSDGDSIESLYNQLIESGYNRDELDVYLDKKGFGIGKVSRYSKYLVHEIKLYLVDNKFPKITNENFKDNKIPNGIVNYQYTVSLDGLEYVKLL